MKLFVVGASGGTGLEIVRQAIARGHNVTAFVRSAERLTPFREWIDIVEGDLFQSDSVAAALASHDAVLSAFGHRLPIQKGEEHLQRDFALSVVAAMQRANVRRIAAVSTAFLFRDSIIPPTYLFGRMLFPGVVRDSEAMERVILGSGLDWTIARPPQFTDGERTGAYRIREGHLPRFGFKIARADVADFLLKTVEEKSFVCRIAGISN